MANIRKSEKKATSVVKAASRGETAKINRKSATAVTHKTKREKLSGNVVSEELLVYVSHKGKPGLMFEKKGTPVHAISFDEKLGIINRGITKKELLVLKDKFDFSLVILSRILDITDRTIQIKPDGFRFTGNVAEKILNLSELYSYGTEVFQERSRFIKWLDTPNPVLNDKRPEELLVTALGMEQVKQELARLDYGIY